MRRMRLRWVALFALAVIGLACGVDRGPDDIREGIVARSDGPIVIAAADAAVANERADADVLELPPDALPIGGTFDAGTVVDAACVNETSGIDWDTVSDDTKEALDPACWIFFAPPADAGVEPGDAGVVLDCNARSDLELACWDTAVAIDSPPDDQQTCPEACSGCPTTEPDVDETDTNSTPPLAGGPATLTQADLDAGAQRALGVSSFLARRDAKLLQKLLEPNVIDLVKLVDGETCQPDELVFFGGIQGFQTPGDRELCEKDSPRLHGQTSIPDYDLLVDDPDSDAEQRGDNTWSARSAKSRLRDKYGTDSGVGDMYWSYAWYGIERRFNANFTGHQLRRVTILNYYNASSSTFFTGSNPLIVIPRPEVIARKENRSVNGLVANVTEWARFGRYKSYLGDKSDVRVLGAIAALPGLPAFVNADSSKLVTRTHATMQYRANYTPWLKADTDDFPKHWENLAPDWNGEAIHSVLRAYKCGQPILAHSGGGASLAYVMRMIDAYVQIANRSDMVARWAGRNLRVIGLEAAMSSEGAAMLQSLPTFAHRAGVLNFAGNVFMSSPRVAPGGTTEVDKWVEWSAGDPYISTKAKVTKADWRNPTWNGTIRVAVYHLAGTLLETEAVDPYVTSWIPDTDEVWNHGDMSTSTQWTGWVAGRSGWDKDYKIRDLLTRPLDGDLKASFLSNAFARYVVAEGNGGGAVNADRPAAGPWETFAIHDLNGGALKSGDPIFIGTSSSWFLCADRIPGRRGFTPRLNATRRNAGPWEQMVIYKLDAAKLAAGVYATTAGAINDGDPVAVQSDIGNWMVAEPAGTANIDRPALGPWEVFRFKKR